MWWLKVLGFRFGPKGPTLEGKGGFSVKEKPNRGPNPNSRYKKGKGGC